MSDLNKVMLIGRLTRDPEVKEFANGGKVANLGLVVHNRRRNKESGAWEETPVWLTLKAFNRDSGGKLADLAEKHLHRGQQVFAEGHLALEEWEGKEDGRKQSRTLVYVDELKFMDAAPAHKEKPAASADAAAKAAEPAARPGRRPGRPAKAQAAPEEAPL